MDFGGGTQIKIDVFFTCMYMYLLKIIETIQTTWHHNVYYLHLYYYMFYNSCHEFNKSRTQRPVSTWYVSERSRFFVYFHFPYELEQNQSISLTNSADVGSPRRIIQIWKISLYATTPELIFALSRKNRHLYIHFIN